MRHKHASTVGRSWTGYNGGVVTTRPAKVKARYWHSSYIDFGRVHIANGDGVFRTIRHGSNLTPILLIEFYCEANLTRPLASDTADVPGKSLCPTCVRLARRQES